MTSLISLFVVLLLALWLLLGTAYDFAFHGYLRRYLIPEGGDLVARLPHMLALLVNIMLSVFLYVYLEVRRRVWWGRFFLAVTVVLATVAVTFRLAAVACATADTVAVQGSVENLTNAWIEPPVMVLAMLRKSACAPLVKTISSRFSARARTRGAAVWRGGWSPMQTMWCG